jgi:hypothetical protein
VTPEERHTDRSHLLDQWTELTSGGDELTCSKVDVPPECAARIRQDKADRWSAGFVTGMLVAVTLFLLVALLSAGCAPEPRPPVRACDCLIVRTTVP